MSSNIQRAHDPSRRALVFFGEHATPEFWERMWSYDHLRAKVEAGRHWSYLDITRRHLAPGDGPILEGGCGIGHAVYGMKMAGYNAIGLDFARRTLDAVKALFPDLDLREGDVRSLPLPDASMAGYWSLGVIEHFWDGYQPILREMARVLRPGGILFLTFPYMSPLRRLKVALGLYPRLPAEPDISRFYQFALDRSRVLADLRAEGFNILEDRPDDGIKGFKDEVNVANRWLQAVYDGKRFNRGRQWLNRLLSSFAGHILLVVAQRAGRP